METRESIQTLKQVDREVNRLSLLQGSLLGAIAERTRIFNREETSQLVALRQEIQDSGLLRAEINARSQNYKVIQGQVTQLEETYAAHNRAFYAIEDRMKKDEVKRVLIADLLKLKELLSNDGLPLAYSRLQFETLARMTQSSLAKLEAQFSIDIDRSRDLAFTFKRLDRDGGVELPMNSLSGGQKVRLCVAFLMAVQQHMVPDVGLLVLDEPTTSVDEEGRVAIAEFLVGLGKELSNTDMQIWVCDHSTEVQQVISCKIELK
jgi:ABC-type glutathione transport system ATPase component